MLTGVLLAAGLLVDGSLRSEVMAGSPSATQSPNSASFAADVAARTTGPELTLRFLLSPSAVTWNGTQLYIRGVVEAERRLGGGATAIFRQRAGYGIVDLSPVAAAPQPKEGEPITHQPPPESRFVLTQEWNTSMEVQVPASRRLKLSAMAAWAVSGGASAEARAELPLARGPQLRAQAEWQATRLDVLRAAIDASYTDFSSGHRVTIVNVLAGWRTLPFRNNELAFAIGPGFGSDSSGATPPSRNVYLFAAADWRTDIFRDLSGSIGAAMEPISDARTGVLVEQAALRLTATWRKNSRMALSARVIGSVAALTTGEAGITQVGDRFVQGELTASAIVRPRLTLQFGARAATLSRPLPGQASEQWVVFGGLVFHGTLLP